MLIQLKFNGRGSRSVVSSRSIGSLAMALVCGSLVAACSGTIETPTEEFPARQQNNSAAADDDDDDSPAPTPPRPTAQAPAPPAADDDDDDDDAPAAPDPDDEPAAEEPAAQEPDEPVAEEPVAAAGDVSFASDIQPIFNGSCGPCHVASGLGGQNIGSDDLDEAFNDSVAFEEEVLRDISSGRMPIGCGGPPGSGGNCVSEDDFTAIEAWYAAGAPE